ncbi:DUF4241 domain-containing protein [Labrys sp. LIt4]|uniref:DUF4241 domain-containing protein n=1 Tax=Labrys TaxID=204476 RepID=UPI0015E44F56|nr:DUF4241 domain-containing protein [Labrys okinawensis]MBP0582133.1 DUF4241 domain-containing protein [Labrys sp. LIt4]
MPGIRWAFLAALACCFGTAAPSRADDGPLRPDAARFEAAFRPGATGTVKGTSVPLDSHVLGEVTVSTGQIVACDPFVFIEAKPFIRAVPKGRFPVRIAVMRSKRFGDRIAFARVEFSQAPVVTWERALVPGQDPAKLGKNEYYGFPVDAGTGAFLDPAVGAEIVALPPDQMQALDDDWIRQAESYGKEHGLPFALPVSRGAHALVLFSSGWGDGAYPSWFGLAADGSVAMLLTDLRVVDDPGRQE